ncbi:Ig-like domain-containing protein [Micromonospora sp. NPDC049559]|uniref:Ig-like domain-containing protein n=1 Tax=Micromonospora sp. NPDC049559 TaxID=3155923 RepID=UPI00342A0DD2
MWGRRLTTAVVLATVVVAGGFGPGGTAPARAQTPGDPVFGDVDGDGFRDRIYLGTVEPGQCAVIVEYGRPGGMLMPPVAYTYLRPGGTDVRCPDIGVAVNLDLDNDVDELMVAWSGGPPPTIARNLLVLGPDFMPAFGISTFVSRPRYLGSADFNADGRADVYALSSADRGLETYYSLGDGTLTVGPLRWCAGTVEPAFKDFDRDGATAAVVAYTEGCSDDANGVVKVSSNGDVQQLQYDPAGVRQWQAKVAYVNGDSLADIRTLALDTGEIEYFVQVPGTIPARFVESPTAVHDRVTISGDRAATIPVLANDYVTTSARLTIVEPPRYGTAQVTSARTVVYRPDADRRATDRFVYRVTEGLRTSNAAVNIRFAE